MIYGRVAYSCPAPQPERFTMSEKLHLTPEDEFPDDLSALQDQELQVLDSQVQRQLDYEYVAEGEPNPETEFRREDLNEEFAVRDRR
jgi:hypothetical protein